MRKIATLVAFVLLVAAPSARSEEPKLMGFVSGDSLHEFCKAPANKLMCGGYIAGVSDAYATPSGAHDGKLAVRSWCPPQDASLGQQTAVVSKWLDSHPEQWHFSAAVLVAQALAEAFPCK